MNGSVFSGVVVKTFNVPVNEGSSTTVQKSEIVYTEPPFVGFNKDNARATVLANAIVKAKVNVGDPVAPIEVRLQEF